MGTHLFTERMHKMDKSVPDDDRIAAIGVYLGCRMLGTSSYMRLWLQGNPPFEISDDICYIVRIEVMINDTCPSRQKNVHCFFFLGKDNICLVFD